MARRRGPCSQRGIQIAHAGRKASTSFHWRKCIHTPSAPRGGVGGCGRKDVTQAIERAGQPVGPAKILICESLDPSCIITCSRFCNGRLWLHWNTFPRAFMCCGFAATRVRQMLLIERSNTSRVQLKMSRVKVILVAVMPALFMLVSTDCLGDSTSSCHRDNFCCLFSPGGSGKHKSPSADNSFDSTVQRCTRRVNVQPGTDGFGTPVALAQTVIRPQQTISPFVLLPTNLEPIQSWQFLWRTALEPRAPSSVS